MQTCSVGQLDRDVPVAGGGQPLHLRRRTGHIGWQVCAGQIAPQHGTEIAHSCSVDGQARQDCHATFARKATITLRVACIAKVSVTIKIKAGGKASVRRQCEAMGVWRASSSKLVRKSGQRDKAEIEIEGREHNNVSIKGDKSGNSGEDLGVFSRCNITQQQARPGAVQFDVIRGDAQGICQHWQTRQQKKQKN